MGVFLSQITEIWKGQFYKKYNLLEGDKRTEFENEFIEKLKVIIIKIIILIEVI